MALLGDDPNRSLYVSCPLHKRNFRLNDGECLNDPEYKILAFDVREQDGELLVLVPESDELDAVIGTSKWMVRQADIEMFGKSGASQVEIVGPGGRLALSTGESSCSSTVCGNSKLEW